MEVSAVRVGLSTNLCPAHTARIVVLIATRQDEEQRLAYRICLFASWAEKTGRFKLPKAIRHAVILEDESSLVSNAIHDIQPLDLQRAAH